jgi:hypothetical protein
MKQNFKIGDVVWVIGTPRSNKCQWLADSSNRWLAEISCIFGDYQFQIIYGPIRTTRFGWQLELANIEDAMLWKLENA